MTNASIFFNMMFLSCQTSVFLPVMVFGHDDLKISGILKNMGHDISASSVRRILQKYYNEFNRKKFKKWKYFIKKHIKYLFACDFKVIENEKGETQYILFVIHIFSRKIVHYNVSSNPCKKWLTTQFKKITDGSENIFLITDNDTRFKNVDFKMLNIDRFKIKPYTPVMNAFIERFIGTFKREALNYYKKYDYNENKLRFICREFVKYYNNFRPHQGIDNLTIPSFLDGQNNKKTSDITVKKVKTKKFLDDNITHFYYKKCA